MEPSNADDINKGIPQEQECHLFVLVHGLWGGPNHMLTVERCLKESLVKASDKKIVILRPSSFRFWKTYDGIKICAERVLFEMFYEMETLKHNNYKVTELSVVGYSLGGLISRYLIGILEEIGFFNYVKPIFFSTFATPHVGIEFFKNNFFDKTANAIGGYLFGESGRQLFIVDHDKLLVQMADPNSRYFKGLARFEQRILLANIKNDRSVSFFTSFISEYAPFEKFDIIKIKYLKDLPESKIGNAFVRGKIVDLTRSKFEINETSAINVQEETSILRSSKLVRVGIILLGVFILPIWIPTIFTISFATSIYAMTKIRVLTYPNFEEHWERVKEGVYGNKPVDDTDYKIGTQKRQQRKDLKRHESFKGDTSGITETAMERMLYADERFIHGDGHVVDPDESGDREPIKDRIPDQIEEETDDHLEESDRDVDESTEIGSFDTPKTGLNLIFHSKKKTIDIDQKAHDQTMKRHLESLSSTDYENYPLFTKDSKLKMSEEKQFIIDNLNSLDWVKMPVYLYAWNAHDGIVARRGAITNPKGTANVMLWVSVLRVFTQAKSESE